MTVKRADKNSQNHMFLCLCFAFIFLHVENIISRSRLSNQFCFLALYFICFYALHRDFGREFCLEIKKKLYDVMKETSSIKLIN